MYFLWFLLTTWTSVQLVHPKFIRFKENVEYVYNLHSDIELEEVGKFRTDAQISYTAVESTNEYQEILLRVYQFSFRRAEDQGTELGHDMDLSRWFSFQIKPTGQILRVYHPPEDDEVLATKKGLAALLSGEMHDKNDKLDQMKNENGHWKYETKEIGNEGLHTAAYLVKEAEEEIEFKKTRTSNPIENSKGYFEKTMSYHKELGIIHKVLIEDSFTALSGTPEFDPHMNMRKVKAVNEFDNTDYPEMTVLSKGQLKFLSRHPVENVLEKPLQNMLNSSIHIDKVNKKKSAVNIEEKKTEIEDNIKCIKNEPEEGSPMLNKCFLEIIEILKILPDQTLKDVAEFYLVNFKPILIGQRDSTSIMLDAFGTLGALGSDLGQKIIADLIFVKPKPNPDLVVKYMLHIVSSRDPPNQLILQRMEEMCFHPEKFDPAIYHGKLYDRVMLTLGAVARKLFDSGQEDKAKNITMKIHHRLGLHDPWLYRLKRSTQTEVEQEEYDTQRVILLEALGNAAMDHSYDYIVSHINDTNSPWIKRAGLHALRKYDTPNAAQQIYTAALYDGNEEVRYEANLLYQSHPKALQHYHKYSDNQTNINESAEVIEQFQYKHDRRKRSFFKGFNFRLEAPSVDWRKVLGSPSLGGSFGFVMANYLALRIAPLSGFVKVNVHDEAYARLHLGIVNRNFDVFVARICFKGETSYNINILQENELKLLGQTAGRFDKIIPTIMGGINKGIKLIKDLIEGKLNLNDIVEKFSNNLIKLPERVADLRSMSMKAMQKLGQFDSLEMPAFIKPVENLVSRVEKFLNNLKSDVMAFYNKLFETVTVIIPENARIIFKSLGDIINGLKGIIKDPPAGLAKIGKGAIQIYTSVKRLLNVKTKIQEACGFLKDSPLYWFDLTEIVEIVELSVEVVNSLTINSKSWIEEKITEAEDTVYQFSKGNVTTNAVRQIIVDDLKVMVNELMSSLEGLTVFAEPFLNIYHTFFSLVKMVKEAYTTLKDGYEQAKSLLASIFGPRAHRNFPNVTRLSGSGCDYDGFYPVKDRGGIDLEILPGDTIVAPFPGLIMLSDNGNEVIIQASGGFLKDIDVVIKNINPNSDILHPDDELYIEKQVAAGVPIGTATYSGCDNHINVAFHKVGGQIDPTGFIQKRGFQLQPWHQACDDYRLEFMGYTIFEGSVIGALGKLLDDISPGLSNDNAEAEDEPELSGDAPGSDIDDIKDGSMFGKVKDVFSGAFSKRSTRSTFNVNDAFDVLVKKADSFLKKFSLKKLKMGQIIDFLNKLGMDETMKKMGDIMKTIQSVGA